MVNPTISSSVARYIVSEATKLLKDGWGERDGDSGLHGTGLIDEMGGDTNSYRFMNATLAFVRFIAGILSHALIESEEPRLLTSEDFDFGSSLGDL